MRVLVTGGAGFIGSHVAERLLDRGDEVVCLDDFNDFYDPAEKRRNIAAALGRRGYALVEGDVCDPAALDRALEAGTDAVVHLAAWAGVRPSIARPALYQRVNVGGTLEVLEACRRHGVGRLVFASSSSVYGGRTDVPFRETDDVSRPVSPYAATKVAGEALCHAYHRLFGISIFCLRFFTVYGPRQRPEMAVRLFAERMRRCEPVTVFGDGSSARDYTYIDDIVDGTIASLDRCSGFEVLNLGGSRATSLKDLVRLIAARLGVEPRVVHASDQAGDVPITFADVSRAERLIGYRPRVGLEEGIDRFCAWLDLVSGTRCARQGR